MLQYISRKEVKMKTLMQRYEKKFLLSKNQYNNFLDFIRKHLSEDPHHVNHEPYHVETIYFDDSTHSFIRHSLSSPAYKAKLRLRSYNHAQHFIELKKKFQGQSYKLRMTLNEHQRQSILNLDLSIFNDTIIQQEFKQMFIKKKLNPVVYVNYLRYAFEETSMGLRITLDQNINYQYFNEIQQPLFPNQYILEIKCHQAFPIWLVKYLSGQRLHHQSLSKYGHSYISHAKGSLYVTHD